MRKIKFKCWIPPFKYMSKGLTIGELIDKTSHDEGVVYLQFTGLLDNNGKEIYVGDIFGNPEMLRCVVEQEPDGAYVLRFIHPKMKNKKISILDDKVSRSPVIGNIHENPELLTPPQSAGS